MIWTIHKCPCEHGIIYCLACDGACDHDKLCLKCHGWSWYPVKVITWIDRIVADPDLYRTRKDALNAIID